MLLTIYGGEYWLAVLNKLIILQVLRKMDKSNAAEEVPVKVNIRSNLDIRLEVFPRTPARMQVECLLCKLM
jgi:hypothetical protein